MLYGLEPRLQRRFERHEAYEMFHELKLIFQANAQIERYEVSNKFYSYKMKENSSVSEHILKMSGYNNHLIQLGVNIPDDSVIDRILQSLPPSYKSFVMNYNMQGMTKTILMLLEATSVFPQRGRDDVNDSRAFHDDEIDEGRNKKKSIKC